MIGILTFWGVPNYGAFAQAYALQKCVSMIKEEKVVDIAYLHPQHYNLYYLKEKPELWGDKFRNKVSYFWRLIEYRINKKKKYPHFEQAWNTIPHINFKNEKQLEAFEWEKLILGSDAIWEYSIPEFGFDQHLIGLNLKSNKIVSYAASFGNMSISDNFPTFVKDGLRKIDNITVRDNSSAEIIEKLIGKKTCVVLDPTFLWEFKDDKNIIVPSDENYILVYGQDFPESLIKEVKSIAEREKLKIVGVGLFPEWVDEKLFNISPFEWIGRFAKASFVVTCTFHGLMFSTHFKKKCVFNQVPYVKNRSEWLIQKLQLSNIYGIGQNVNDILSKEWDFDMISIRAKQLRMDSINKLKEILE